MGDVSFLTLEMSITGAVSFFASLFILVTWAAFRELHSKQYIQHIVCVEFCCLMQSIAVLLGPHQASGSPRCWFQGLVLVYFPLCAVLWTLVVSYQLYAVVMTGKVLTGAHSLHRHAACWLLPLVTTLLPLTTNTYGQIAGQVNVCTVANRSDSPQWGQTFWMIASFYGWLWAAIALILVGFAQIVLRVRQQALPAVIRGSIVAMGSYPLILVFCWSVPTFARIFYALPENGQKGDDDVGRSYPGESVMAVLANVLPNLQGFFFALALVATSDEVRQRWSRTVGSLLGWEGSDRESFLSSGHNSARLGAAAKDGPGAGPGSFDRGTMGGGAVAEGDAEAYPEHSRFSRLSRFLVPTLGGASGTSSRSDSADGFGYSGARFSLSGLAASMRFSSASHATGGEEGQVQAPRPPSQISMSTFRSSLEAPGQGELLDSAASPMTTGASGNGGSSSAAPPGRRSSHHSTTVPGLAAGAPAGSLGENVL